MPRFTDDEMKELQGLHTLLTQRKDPRAAQVVKLMSIGGPQGFDEAHPILGPAIGAMARATEKASTPLPRLLGGENVSTLTEQATKYLGEPIQGGFWGPAKDVGHIAAGLGDFLSSPIGIVTLASGGGSAAMRKLLSMAFAGQMGTAGIDASKKYAQAIKEGRARDPEALKELQHGLLNLGMTAAIGGHLGAPSPEVARFRDYRRPEDTPPAASAVPSAPPPPPGGGTMPPSLTAFPSREPFSAVVEPTIPKRQRLGPNLGPLETETTAITGDVAPLAGKPELFTAIPGLRAVPKPPAAAPKTPKASVATKLETAIAEPVTPPVSAVPSQAPGLAALEKLTAETEAKLAETTLGREQAEARAANITERIKQVERRLQEYGPPRGVSERRHELPSKPITALPTPRQAFKSGIAQGKKRAQETGAAERVVETMPSELKGTPTEESIRQFLGLPERTATATKAPSSPAAPKPLKGTEVLRLEATEAELAAPDAAALKERVQAQAETLAQAAMNNKSLGAQARVNALNRLKIRREQIFNLIDRGEYNRAMEAYKPSAEELKAYTSEQRAEARAAKARERSARNRQLAGQAPAASFAANETPAERALAENISQSQRQVRRMSDPEGPQRLPEEIGGGIARESEISGAPAGELPALESPAEALQRTQLVRAKARVRDEANSLGRPEQEISELEYFTEQLVAEFGRDPAAAADEVIAGLETVRRTSAPKSRRAEPEPLPEELQEEPIRELEAGLDRARYEAPSDVPRDLWGTDMDPWADERGYIRFNKDPQGTYFIAEQQIKEMGGEHPARWERVRKAAIESGFGSVKNLETLITHFIRGASDPAIGSAKATEGLLQAIAKRKGERGFAAQDFVNLGFIAKTFKEKGTLAFDAVKRYIQARPSQQTLPPGKFPELERIRKAQEETQRRPSTVARLSTLPRATLEHFADRWVRFPQELQKRLQPIYGGYGGNMAWRSIKNGDILNRARADKVEGLLWDYLNLRAYSRTARILEQHAQDSKNPSEALDIRTRLQTGKALPEGLTPRKVAQMLQEFERTVPSDRLSKVQRYADEVYKESAEALDDWYNAGVIPKASYDRMKSYGADYISMGRLFPEETLAKNFFGNSAFDVKTLNLIKQLEGSEKINISPLEANLPVFRRGYNIAGRNLLMQELKRYRAEDPEGWGKTMIPAFEEKATPMGRRKFPVTKPKDFVEVGLFEKGEPEIYYVPKELGDVLANVHPLYSRLGINALLDANKLLRAFAHVARTTAVASNIGFAAYNIPKDIGSALLFGQKRLPGQQRKISFVKEFLPTWINIVRKGINDISEDHKKYLRSNTAFATFSHAVSPDIYLGQRLSITENLKRGHLITAVSESTALTEEATKRTMFKLYTDAGVPEKIAAAFVRKYSGSPDFAAGGLLRDALNMYTLFFNVRLQGVRRTVDFTVENPKIVLNTLAKGTAAIAALMAYNYQYRDQETGEVVYDLIPAKAKRDAFIVLLPGPPEISATGAKTYPYLPIPKFYEAQQYLNPIEAVLEKELFGDKGLSKQDALDIVSSVSPLYMDLEADNAAESALRSAASTVNPAIGAPAEQMLNYETFWDRPIVPQDLEGISREFQNRPHTSESMSEMGRGNVLAGTVLGGGLGAAIGGVKGAAIGAGIGAGVTSLRPSPIRTEALIRRTMGGLGQTVVNATDKLFKEEPSLLPQTRRERIGEIPFLGDVMRRYMPGPAVGFELELNNKFYNIAQQAQETQNTMNNLRRTRPHLLQEYLSRPKVIEDLRAGEITQKVRTRLAENRSRALMIQQSPSMSDDQKKSLLRGLNQEREALLLTANEMLEGIREGE